jgi:hypothetical protein
MSRVFENEVSRKIFRTRGRKLQEFREKFVMRRIIIYVYTEMLIFGYSVAAMPNCSADNTRKNM